MTGTYRNISFATADSFRAVLEEGAKVNVRDHDTLELRNRVTTLQSPRERCVFLPGRRNDVFAQVAETMWVIGGRNDVPWLARYLPKAPDFSDDGGATWRGAYGPRLRAWGGRGDQLDQWRQLLLSDRQTRRAVGVIFDPARDFVESRDVPCNNWISWLIREDKLHMNVAIRSNDAMWGFSGVNAFEWSVLQDMMATWVGAEVGEAAFFATSYHLYDRHYDRARNVVDRFYGISPYDFGVQPPPFVTPWERFPAALAHWFAAEERLSSDPEAPLLDGPALADPFLRSTLSLLRLKWGAAAWSTKRLRDELKLLPENDFTAAAYEQFGRSRKELWADVPHAGIRAFDLACKRASASDTDRFGQALKALHARKNASYGASWKRRGERVSVLPNIARKIDRLETFALTQTVLEGETVLDTAVDLFVYAAKYQLLLAEQPDACVALVPPHARHPLSDHDENFDHLADSANFTAPAGQALGAQIDVLVTLFEPLWRAAETDMAVLDRQRLAQQFALESARLIGIVAAGDAKAVSAFIRNELKT
ncbi:MAG: hypothetical protein KKD64_11385 [Alphaproteobacteria bacterium]|nr:hypothetical protein [Alphaproteobacteria bacterium]MBU0794054.1 hypothetical protein [Alphaproteobacteria bacterium]MBU0877377.1 hypothetical protein [Alphaproteobacteria bacterium]MBU1770244.1 hypothetical protein [Alphaproteobacteria bacterium]